MKKNFFRLFLRLIIIILVLVVFWWVVVIGQIYYEFSYPNKLFFYPTSPPVTKGLRVISHTNDYYKYPAWSPDGKIIAVMRNNKNIMNDPHMPFDDGWQVGLVDISSGRESIINLDGERYVIGNFQRVVWSADSNYLIFPIVDGDKKSKWVKYSMSDKKWEVIQLETPMVIAWRSDGSIVTRAFIKQKPDGYIIWGIASWNISTGKSIYNSHSLTSNLSFDDTAPLSDRKTLELEPHALSPSGQTLLMTLTDTYKCEGIWKYSLGEEKAAPFIDTPEKDECDPSFSWDGSKIVYTERPANSSPQTSLIVANADGSLPKVLTFPNLVEKIRYPIWSSDGKQIAFAYGRFNEDGTNLLSQIVIVDVPLELQPILNSK